MKALAKSSGKLSAVKYIMFYVHRYIRLTPLYAAMILLSVAFWPYAGEGPMWPDPYQLMQSCRDYWWRNLLYINNLVGDKPGDIVGVFFN